MNRKGFSLIEILVSLSIVSVITGVAFVSIANARGKGMDNKRKTDILAIKRALVSAQMDEKYYKKNITDGSLTPNYIVKVPKDPKSNTDYIYIAYPLGCDTTNKCTSFVITACIENPNDSERDTTVVSACLSAPYNGQASYTVKSPI